MSHRRLGLAAGLVVAVLTLSACDGSEGVGTEAYAKGDGTAVEIAEAQRGEPVEVSGTTLTGEQLDLASMRGRTVVLNVWGSWCAPCRKEAKDLVAASKQLGPRGVDFVGINLRDNNTAQALAYEQKYGITFPSLKDDGGELLLAFRGAVPPKAIPTTLVIDPQGRIAARFSGAITQRTLVDLVEGVTGASAAPSSSAAPAAEPST